jgi:hypothetical protein
MIYKSFKPDVDIELPFTRPVVSTKTLPKKECPIEAIVHVESKSEIESQPQLKIIKVRKGFKQTIDLMIMNKTVDEIALARGISFNAAKSSIDSVYKRFKVNNRASFLKEIKNYEITTA